MCDMPTTNLIPNIWDNSTKWRTVRVGDLWNTACPYGAVDPNLASLDFVDHRSSGSENEYASPECMSLAKSLFLCRS